MPTPPPQSKSPNGEDRPQHFPEKEEPKHVHAEEESQYKYSKKEKSVEEWIQDGKIEEPPLPPIPVRKPVRSQKKSQSAVSEKVSGLAKLISAVSKKHGEGSLIQMNNAAIKDVGTISSGSLGLDYALGIGGYPRGRIVEVYGPAAAGKSTLTPSRSS